MVLDLDVPEGDGVDLLATLRRGSPPTRRCRSSRSRPQAPPTCAGAPALRARATSWRSRSTRTEAAARVENVLAAARLATQGGEMSDELDRTRLESVIRLARLAEYRDDATYEHPQRVGRTAALLAARLGLAPDTVEAFRTAAPLHDVGKVGVPDRILLKPGRLTAAEFELMKSHTLIGAEILSGSTWPLLQMAEEIALSHHERWDGTGYPDGKEEEKIPLSGRIVIVADNFDALTHSRPTPRRGSPTKPRPNPPPKRPALRSAGG